MSTTPKSPLAIIGLILATSAALAAMGTMGPGSAPPPLSAGSGDDLITITTEVAQDKILQGGDGQVTVSLTLAGAGLPTTPDIAAPPSDLVVVLDRSGSMEGQKIDDARQAIIQLLDQLGPDDRLGLLTYSNGVQTGSPLVPMNDGNRPHLATAVRTIRAGGGTNLGAGLESGIAMLLQTPGDGRQRKLILISDGLANQGIIQPEALGQMASRAAQNHFSISTVGVGLDFNEVLMTAIADQGAGRYHFLENPQVFARVFESELQAARQVAAADVQLRIPQAPGVRLVSAGGYPIRHEDGRAVIHPGNLLSGQRRTVYLTFTVPTDTEGEIVLGQIQAQYRHNDRIWTTKASGSLTVACVPDAAAVMASIKKKQWGDQVVREVFSRLKEEVAADIRNGDKARAKARIQAYEDQQASINAVVGSSKVARNLETDLHVLRDQVDDTFAGAPAAVAEKKKQVSKSLQYEGYRMRRDK
jgi:Ca-activated chloride channel family protein